MSQTQLNGRQVRWMIQLAPYDFTIYYRKGFLNPADGLSQQPDYLTDREVVEETSVGKLIPTLSNKLAGTAALRTCERSQVKGVSPYAEGLMKVLSLQVTTRAQARSAADDLQPYILEDEDFPGVALLEDSVSEEKDSILKLILSAQELDPQCKRIFSQLRDHGTQSPSLALEQQQRLQLYSVDEDGLLKVADCVLVPPQEALRNQLLETYHDCPSGRHWGKDKTLELIRRHFTWDGISEDVRAYVTTCLPC